MNYQIELRHLHYFKMVAEELHFRRAAEKLFIAQPGLSRQIKQLEEYYGTPLFLRNNRNVALTSAGEYLKKEVDIIFNQLSKVKEHIEKVGEGKITSLKLGFIGSAVQTIFPQLLVRLKKQQPLVDITLNELSNEVQLEMLRNHKLDFGFVRMDSAFPPLQSIPIVTDHFSIVVPKKEKYKKLNKINLNDFQNESFILFSREYSSSYYDLVMSIFKDHGFKPNVTLKTVNALTIFNLVKEEMGIAIVPSSLKKGYHTHVDFLSLSHLPQRTTLSLLWNEENRNPGIPLMINTIKDMLQAHVKSN
ncbi:MAG TPA: LysR family transcriptional regulator [Candidatus Sphingobacterium stercoripullorum]|uniref:LysR family transcriptional regulator n=1 Tax=Candidatus Sphingobacterium stercoripullorum TaxID=2838759 RepID=A0A9D1W8M3_9SPHI|nr:LysR family transcriptional regulator [Candidatus Sphingobacterium stercoripullorum]